MATLLNRVVEIARAALGNLRAVFHPSKPWVARAQQLGRSRRMRTIGVIVLAILLFIGPALYIAVPPLLRHVLAGPVTASLHRQVSVGKVRFNIYRLKLDLENLHIAERDDPQKPFVDLGHVAVKVSWKSLFRLAPVVGEVLVERPQIHVVRESPQKFNFSDLLESAPPPKETKPAAPSKPFKFAVSNIQLHDGQITIDDQVFGKQHKVDKIEVDVPFIANLPSDVDIYVQPLVQMTIDGSPLRIAGVAKPFLETRDSVLDLKLHRLDLPQYVSYSPTKLPVKIPSGALSTDLYLHFVQQEGAPLIRLNGTVALDQLDVRDPSDAPLLALKHAEVKLTDVEPLAAVFNLKSIWIDGLVANLRLNADGTNNLTALAGNKAPAAASTPAQAAAASTPAQSAAAGTPASAPTPAANMAQAAAPAAGSTPAKPAMNVGLESFVLTKSEVDVQDNSGPAPATDTLQALEVGLKNFQMPGQSPATYYLTGNLKSGGTLSVNGALNLGDSQTTTVVSIDQIDLPGLQPFAQKYLAATLASGKISAKANVQTHFASNNFNVHAEPASVAIANFELDQPHETEKPVQWKNFSVSVGQFDLASHQATVTEVKGDAIHVFVRRDHNGKLSLESLMRTSAPPAEENKREMPRVREARRALRERRRVERERKPVEAATPAAAPSPAFQFQVASVVLDQTDATVVDESASKPVKVNVAPLNVHLKDVTSDFAKPFDIDIDGTLNRKGTFKVTGKAAIAPLKADLRVGTKRLDLAFADPYVASRMNAVITSANLTIDGAVGLEQQRKDFLVSYKGDVSLGSVRMLDKLTNDLFFRMSALNVNRIDFALGKGPMKAHVGLVALNDFYSRIILNKDGKLNLKDITANPQEAPTSLTRAEGAPGSKGVTPVAPTSAPTPAAAASAAAAPSPGASPAAAASPAPYQGKPLDADIEMSKITMKGGKVDYTDNFIKPNYSANITDLAGSIGAFGTKSTAPAPVTLNGEINGSSPLSIDGQVNPLAPTAFVDIKAKADAVELTGVSPYTIKYTGYPITKGTLTVDVHYLLDTGKLTADNHIFIDQLTFGDRVESSSATNLPIRLAVSLLKNSKGQIDLHVPISGSLSDPQFSIGSVVLGAFENLIIKAATAPFSLLAAAFGSVTGGGAPQDLAYIEFAPGYSTLTPESQQKLDTVAKALADRTALKLNIEGRVDPKFDTDGFREASLDKSIRKLSGKSASDSDSADSKPSAPLSQDDYNKYLKKVYSAGDFKKPRDTIGLAKTLPPDQMKKLILENTPVTDQDFKNLADARANAVRAYLSKKQVDSGRMFIVAPKMDANGIKDQGKTTRVDLSLQ